MKKLVSLFIFMLMIFTLMGCKGKDDSITYEIKVVENLPTEFHVGTTTVDFKPYFIITDSNGNQLAVEDQMIDQSNVDFSTTGDYFVKITYKGVEKVIQITIIDPEISYVITINEALPKEFQVGAEPINFNAYFTVTDSNGHGVEVLEHMITSNVNFNQVGEYKVTLTYAGVFKELVIKVTPTDVDPDPNEEKVASDLFISEYFEGVSYDKYIELFNGTGETIDLSEYSIALYNNAATPTQYTLHLTGALKDGDTYVIYNSRASSSIASLGDVSHSVTQFNGNDVVALYKGDTRIDVVGDLNNPVKEGWAIGDVPIATAEHTLVRKSLVKGPNPLWTPEEWNVFGQGDLSSLKQHQMDGHVPNPQNPDDPNPDDPHERMPDLLISEYFEGNGVYKDSKYIEIYNGLSELVNLEGYALALYKDGSTIPSYTESLSGVLNPGEVFVVYSPYAHEGIKSLGNLESEVTYFNGKAAVALLKDEEVIDVIGVIGEYPKDGWKVDDYSTTQNNVLIRKETIDSPTATWDPSEWYSCYENYLFGLGNHLQEGEEKVYEQFDELFILIKNLQLNDKGTATSEEKVKVRGTVFMDVKEETSLVYLTDGKNIIKLHGEKIHNYTTPGVVYEIEAYVKAHIYQPTLEVINPSSDITPLRDLEPVTSIEVKAVSLSEIIALKREDFVENINKGYLQSMLKVTGFLQFDTHNSNRYDYAFTVNETYTKNNTGNIASALYLKNEYQDLYPYLHDFVVLPGEENVEIEIYGVLYEWNTNRKNWLLYSSVELTRTLYEVDGIL